MENKAQFPLGHFYSPFPDLNYVLENEKTIFALPGPEQIGGVNMRAQEQFITIQQMVPYYKEIPWDFSGKKTGSLRYQFENGFYSYGDATFLYSTLRHIKPKRIIEIGCGFSSACMLDTNDVFFDGKIEMTFIDPYPEVLNTLLTQHDRESKKVQVIAKKIQEIEPGFFTRLEANDLLFVDSGHVLKCGGDVNHILFNILPVLGKGVYVHFHDIMYPFEYPKVWVTDGRAWNEAYAIRAFLQYNDTFELFLSNSYLARFNQKFMEELMPLCLKNPGGSIYLRKTK